MSETHAVGLGEGPLVIREVTMLIEVFLLADYLDSYNLHPLQRPQAERWSMRDRQRQWNTPMRALKEPKPKKSPAT